MNNLAACYGAAGRHAGGPASSSRRRCQLRKAKLGPDHPDTLPSMNNLAAAYWSLKQLDKSIPLFEESS